MSQSDIRAALQSRLHTWAQTKDYQVAWENVPFNPPADIYLKAFLLPATTGSQDLEGKHREYIGVWQITIVGKLDESPAAVETIAAELENLFPLNERITAGGNKVLITTPMSIAKPIITDRYELPISCNYRMDTI